jgi:lycopene beta-cyclase
MSESKKYDLIIAGAGLSGLSLAWHLIQEDYKGQVLLIDESFAPNNSKTWCFWGKKSHPFTEIAHRTWRQTDFSALDFSSRLAFQDHRYYCVKESDYKEKILRALQKAPNFDLLEESILDFSSNSTKAALITKDSNTYLADYIFQSIFLPSNFVPEQRKYPLIQHFLGLEIKTKEKIFDKTSFTLMDVDETFDQGFAFMYLLPFKKTRALAEFTVFSDTPLKKKEYKKKIKSYLKKNFGLDRQDYLIKRKEYGEIPMDDRPHTPTYASRIFNLGTVGGFTKPSTGYTFSRVHKYSKACAKQLARGKKPLSPTASEYRFRYYDLLLLRVLATDVPASRKIFRSLFKNSPVDRIFKFLSEETSFTEDLKILSSCHYPPFLKALTVHPPFLTQFKTQNIQTKHQSISSFDEEDIVDKHNHFMDVEIQ